MLQENASTYKIVARESTRQLADHRQNPGEESVLGTADKGRTHSARKCIDLQDSDKNQMDTTAGRLETKTITPAYTWDC